MTCKITLLLTAAIVLDLILITTFYSYHFPFFFVFFHKTYNGVCLSSLMLIV